MHILRIFFLLFTDSVRSRPPGPQSLEYYLFVVGAWPGNYIFVFQDLKSSGLPFDESDSVIKGLRKGKECIFFSPDFLDILRY